MEWSKLVVTTCLKKYSVFIKRQIINYLLETNFKGDVSEADLRRQLNKLSYMKSGGTKVGVEGRVKGFY